MAQIRIEQKRTGPIWIGAIIVAIIVIVALWWWAQHRSAMPSSTPATPSTPSAYRSPGGAATAAVQLPAA
ncbi:MAG TPA: hypothetical protein VIC55_11265 [Gemmatimonadaceae bacterium]|jgi:FtsZ-interacting cell division protein ZipA